MRTEWPTPENALRLLRKGMTCKEIGQAMHVTAQVAHDLVVQAWRIEKTSKGIEKWVSIE